jgi:hypothetical protein
VRHALVSKLSSRSKLPSRAKSRDLASPSFKPIPISRVASQKMRKTTFIPLVSFLLLALGCGGSSGSSQGTSGSYEFVATSKTTSGQSVNITPGVANESTGKDVSGAFNPAVRTLANETITGTTYAALPTVTSRQTVTMGATSNASVTASEPITLTAANPPKNIVSIKVNGGPLVKRNPPQIYINAAFVSVEVCAPSNGACQTIPDILVDTGSYGLRVLGSQVTVPLTPITDGKGDTLYDCAQFVDNSFLWGAVAPATIVLGGETASLTSVQIIANPGFSIPSGCSGINEDTQALLGANGILGVGPEPFDCGVACDPSAGGTPPPVYYLCSSGGACSTTFVSCGTLCGDSAPNQQVTNPVFNFPVDNNGVILTLQTVHNVAATADGSLTFGIGTEANNTLPSTATLFTLNSADNFTTNFESQSLTASFIDSGSNGLFFPQIDNLPNICSDNNSWYCPPKTTRFTATNVDPNNGTSNTVDFRVDNFDNVTSANPKDAAFRNVAGPMGSGSCSPSNPTACTFEWGLPFFYGRRVFTAIDGTTTPYGNGPFWAY